MQKENRLGLPGRRTMRQVPTRPKRQVMHRLTKLQTKQTLH